MIKLIMGFLVSVLAGLIVWWVTQVLLQPSRSPLNPINTPLPIDSMKPLIIVNPNPENTVDLNNPILGTTPYLDRYHYIVVTTPIGDDFVQQGPLKVANDGTWTESVRFGSAIDGDKKFIIRVLVTRSTITLGPLSIVNLPGDAVFSSPVTVKRK